MMGQMRDRRTAQKHPIKSPPPPSCTVPGGGGGGHLPMLRCGCLPDCLGRAWRLSMGRVGPAAAHTTIWLTCGQGRWRVASRTHNMGRDRVQDARWWFTASLCRATQTPWAKRVPSCGPRSLSRDCDVIMAIVYVQNAEDVTGHSQMPPPKKKPDTFLPPLPRLRTPRSRRRCSVADLN